jgi:transcription antitermination factor NusG
LCREKTAFPTDGGEAMPEICTNSRTTAADLSMTAPKWFAAYTLTHHERRVLHHLIDRRVEAFLPCYETSRKWKKRLAIIVNLPLFPNYVFVRIGRQQRTAVLGTPGVFSIVGSGQDAWELPERDIEALRNGIRERTAEPHPYLTVGERARVVSGPLAGLEGIIVRKKNNLHIVLSLDRIMQSIAIEVAAGELEPIPSGLCK